MGALAQRPARRAAPVLLFADDFDDAPEPPAPGGAAPGPPPPPEAPHTRAELDGARADGFREGRARALADDARARRRSALEDVAGSLREMREEARRTGEQAAEALARLLLAALAAMLPAYCRAHGDAEAAAVLRLVLPGLSREPRVTLRASERTLAALAAELAGLDDDARASLVLTASGTMVDGDVRIAWDQGSAERGAAAIWREIEAALGLSGLSPAVAANPAPAPAPVPAPAPAPRESVDA